jgi:hypothetical protein
MAKHKIKADEDEQVDVQDILKNISVPKLRLFDSNMGTVDLDSFLQYLKSGDEEHLVNQDYVADFVYDVAKDLVEDAISDYEVSDEEKDELMEGASELVYDQLDYNYAAILPSPLLVTDPKATFDEITMDEDSELVDLKAWASKYGFSEKEVEDFYSNASGGGGAAIAVIVTDTEELMGDPDQEVTISGDVVLYIHNSFMGSGYYKYGSGTHTFQIKPKDVPNYTDHGRYSLGDVFGTRDWVWN